MARMFTGSLTKIIAQIAALALVVGGLVAFVVTQSSAQKAQADSENAGPINVELATSVEPLSHVAVSLPAVINLTVGGEKSQVVTDGKTVKEVLIESGIKYTSDDKISPALSTEVKDGGNIVVKKVTTKKETDVKAVDFETKKVNDNTLDKGETKVDTKGEKGEEKITFEITLVDGKEESRKEIKREVTKEPTTEVIKVGTKEEERPAQTTNNSSSTSSTSSNSSASGSSSNSSSSSNSGGGTAPSSGVWARLAQCESNGNWHINTGNGYHGGLQFSAATWRSMGGTKYGATADQATPAQQIEIASKLQARAGWGQWPACSRSLGLR